MTSNADTRTWPELAIGLYDRLTGRNAQISYQFDGFKVDIPSGASPDAATATWRFDGTLRITTKDGQ